MTAGLCGREHVLEMLKVGPQLDPESELARVDLRHAMKSSTSEWVCEEDQSVGVLHSSVSMRTLRQGSQGTPANGHNAEEDVGNDFPNPATSFQRVPHRMRTRLRADIVGGCARVRRAREFYLARNRVGEDMRWSGHSWVATFSDVRRGGGPRLSLTSDTDARCIGLRECPGPFQAAQLIAKAALASALPPGLVARHSPPLFKSLARCVELPSMHSRALSAPFDKKPALRRPRFECTNTQFNSKDREIENVGSSSGKEELECIE
ncbi:hypothetical protein B0H11DRAFT_1940304 [Mycena galericulata]|nr:hypothetical protein B0H11DRAFT_1940304 [Mycena galericulata]